MEQAPPLPGAVPRSPHVGVKTSVCFIPGLRRIVRAQPAARSSVTHPVTLLSRPAASTRPSSAQVLSRSFVHHWWRVGPCQHLVTLSRPEAHRPLSVTLQDRKRLESFTSYHCARFRKNRQMSRGPTQLLHCPSHQPALWPPCSSGPQPDGGAGRGHRPLLGLQLMVQTGLEPRGLLPPCS